MSQKMTFVACGCQIFTSQTTELIPEKIEKLCKLHEPLRKTKDVKGIYTDVFAYSRSFVIPAEPFGTDEGDNQIKLEIIQEDLGDSLEKARRAVSKNPRSKGEFGLEVAKRKRDRENPGNGPPNNPPGPGNNRNNQ